MSVEDSASDAAALDPNAVARARRREDDLLSVLITRNPNGMRLENLRYPLKEMSDEEIDAAAQGLVARGVIRIEEHVNNRVPGRVIRTYWLTDPSQYPIRETVEVGEIAFPRAFMGDTVGAEDLNAFIEAIAEYNDTVGERVRRLTEDLTRRYWANMAVLMGLFVAVFALIVTGAQTITEQASGSVLHLLGRSVVALAPLTIVLFAFVVALWLLLNGRLGSA